MRFITLPILVLLLCPTGSILAADSEQHTLSLNLNNTEHSVKIGIPNGWSVSPRSSKNSFTLVNTAPDEGRRRAAPVQIFVQPRLDHDDALNQIKGSAANIPQNEKEFLTIGGWPAMQTTRIIQQPSPDKAQRFDEAEVLRVTTYIAVDDVLYIVSGSAPTDARPEQVSELKAIARSLSFDSTGEEESVKSELDALRASESPASMTVPDKAPMNVGIDTTPVDILPEVGANDRINTNGDGELEIATSPDGTHVVVALQGRRWVSSNDGGATFPNSGRVGAGNGDPSVAWGQSGKFYMAWIDTSNGCSSGYLGGNPTQDPAWIYGITCTGMARSDDNGVTFSPGLVNPAVICPNREPDPDADDIPGECFPDQEHIAADRWNQGDTPDDDQVYSTWRNFSPGDQNAALVCSSDSGVTWSAPFDIAVNDVFPRITVGKDGFVYVTTYNTDDGNFYIHKFTQCVEGLTPVAGWPRQVGPWDGFRCPFAGHDRCDQNPTSQTAVVDETDPNHVYYAYVLDDESGGNSHSDILVRDSLDGGFTWNVLGRVARANESVGARRIMPWLCTTAGDAVVTWYEQRDALPTDTTDYYGARVGLDDLGNLTAMEQFVLSEVPDNWCDIGWPCLTRWGYTDSQISNAAEACPNQPQLAGQCGDGDDSTPDSGAACDFSDDDGVTFTNCQPAASSPSGNDEKCLGGGGCPKYGDYNGNACAGGKLFAAWASANAPPGLPAPTTPNNPGVLFDVINLEDLGVPVITVPGNVHFGAACEGDDTRYQTLEVCNTGSANLQVDVISSDNNDFEVSVPSSGYPVTISPDFCFPFEVAYSPAGGAETASLTIPSNDPDRPSVEVTADATIGEPNLVTVMDADFGDICLGTASTQQLTILNDGSCDLIVDDVSITSDPANEFELATVMSFPFTLQSGESVSADIEFSPVGDIGAASANVEIDSDDPDTPTRVLGLTGNSPPAAINTFIANSGAFGDVCAADQSDLALTVENTGACPLEIDAVSIVLGANAEAGDFVAPDGNADGTIIAAGNSIQVPIRFAPSAFDEDPAFTRHATVNVTSHTQLASSSLPLDSTDVTGEVPPPDINLAIANDGNFGEVCKNGFADLDLTLFNQGKCDLAISNVELVPPGGSFILPSDLDLPLILSHDADFILPVRYAPVACNDVPEAAQVQVSSDDPDEPIELVDISGVSPCPNLVIDPLGLTGEFAFPATVADPEGTLGCYSERTTVLRNNGNCPLTISDITASGDFSVMAPSVFPVVLPTGEETLGVTVRFVPQTPGDPLAPDQFLGELNVVSDDPDSPGIAEICGEGVAQSGIRVLTTDISSGIPLIVEGVDNITVSSKGKNTPSPIKLQFTDVYSQSVSICGNPVTWHVDQETLPSAQTEGSNPKSSYQTSAREGNLQDAQSFNLGQCDFLEFQLQLRDSDAVACNLLAKGEACTTDGECCSGKCRGSEGGKTCK